jgi:hypothetical protein
LSRFYFLFGRTLLTPPLALQELLNHDDVVELVGPRPFAQSKIYKEYLDTKQGDQSEKPQEAQPTPSPSA